MGWITALFLYLLIWWMILFTQLSRFAGKSGEQETNEVGAPERPKLLRKFVMTSVYAAVILLAIWLVTLTGWFSMFEILTGQQR